MTDKESAAVEKAKALAASAPDEEVTFIKPILGAEERDGLLASDDTERLVRSAPEPSAGAKKVFRVLYPLDRFVVPGLPVVTQEGVALTGEQEKVLLEAVAADSTVRVVSE